MKVNRLQFLDKLKMVFPFVDTKSSLRGYGHECFLFQEGWLSAFNNYTSISVKLPDSFDIDYMLVDAKILKQLFEKMTGDEVNLEYEDSELCVKCGKMRTKIVCVQLHDDPEHSYNIDNAIKTIHKTVNESEWKNLPDNFFQGIDFCNIPDNRNALAGIYMKNDFMCDWAGSSCTWFRLNEKMETVYLPDDRVKSLLKIPGIKKYFTDKSWIFFTTEDESMIFSIRQITEYTFEYNGMKRAISEYLEKDGDIFTGFLPGTISEILERAVIFIDQKTVVPTVKLNFDDTGITIYAKNGNMEFTESVEWENSKAIKAFDPFEVLLNINLLSFGLKEKLIFNVYSSRESGMILSFMDKQNKMYCFVCVKKGK